MAKELLTVTLNAKQVREACEEWAEGRTNMVGENKCTVNGVPDDLAVTVVYSVKRASPRKRTNGNGVASAGDLSPAEQRYG